MKFITSTFHFVGLLALLSGCATVTSTATKVATNVASNVVSTATDLTSVVADTNSNVGYQVVTEATEVTTTVATTAGATVNATVTGIGDQTGLSTLVKAGTQMTPRQSYALGRICAAKILAGHEVVRSEGISKYVDTLGKYLALHSQSPQIYKGYQFVLIEGESPYAVSTPGGFVFISTGMLELAGTEDELAAVIAHEIAHIALKHAEIAIQTANRLDLFGGVFFKTAGYATNLATKTVGLDKVQMLHDLKVIKALKVFDAVTDFVLNEGFNQSQELDADTEATSMLKNAGYNPKALETMITKISDDSGFGTLHPGKAKRLDAVHEALGEHRTPANFSDSGPATLKRFMDAKATMHVDQAVNDRY